ncbi:hypothetical protein [Clostridium sp.]|uniref:hypothetical protein n=1 Tax=Clostridium sp. TaxID=1506 RepID=UPI001B4FB9F9|nr:hypothetical protein [Clostridium sp.]MBP3917443.1 hypothetical protein [Clostridium sp.]
MEKVYVIINENDRFFVELYDDNKKAKFRKSVSEAKFYNKESEAANEAEFLMRRYKHKDGSRQNLKIAEVKFKINILNYNKRS